ncbi:AraC family transcriptional regulator [Marinobacterium rhizophilum]|uniref:AraC family transcriptional regulator n=1 Tax=Marinobacterium rhizophilum TaxID=420402 RepID=A0ABY5HPY0_9GAMM|nr:AraC family transcriptional regulator [Marinobacterium rhizophilum]UTW14184.1 AraC family transcriptional regulator [Marinobacterium rhizophilum]
MTRNTLSPLLTSALLNDASRLVFCSQDMDETRERVGAVFKPHRLQTLGNTGAIDSRLHHVPIQKVSLNRLRYGADVQIEPERLEQFFLIQMPLEGEAEIQCDGQRVDLDPRHGAVLNPAQALLMRYDKGCDQLMLRIEREALEQACSRIIGRPLSRPLAFNNVLNWQQDASWMNMLLYIVRLQKESPEGLQQPLITQQLEQLIISTLLCVQPSNYSDALRQNDRRLAPRHVKRVEEHIEQHAREPLSPALLAELAGVSLRTLYAGFREFRNLSPMEYLRQVRLQNVRQDLLHDCQSKTVTELAMAWGFTHMGRFSKDYRLLYGESPSETKRRTGRL